LKGRPAAYIGQGSYTTADGSEHETSLYRLDSLTVGGLTVTNVECLISSGEAGQQASLLGLSFLRKFRSWSINNARNVLVLEKW
jgi:predicted aspartyl protease